MGTELKKAGGSVLQVGFYKGSTPPPTQLLLNRDLI